MPRTASPQSMHSIPFADSSRLGMTSVDSNRVGNPSASPATVARAGRHDHHRQVASAAASGSQGSGYTAMTANGNQSDVTSRAGSQNTLRSAYEKSQHLPTAGSPVNPNLGGHTKAVRVNSHGSATDNGSFDFKYKNVYTTPSTRSAGAGGVGSATPRGRATIGNGSGAGSGMGACSLM